MKNNVRKKKCDGRNPKRKVPFQVATQEPSRKKEKRLCGRCQYL